MQELSSRNALFTESQIRKMTRLCTAYGAVNLAQGYPDFNPPAEIVERLQEISILGPHQYPISMGAPNFRQALAEKAGRCMGRELDPETDMVVTIGSTEAMISTLNAVTDPGDKIILFSPFFENYRAQILNAGCVPVFSDLKLPDFSIDFDDLEKAFSLGVKAILICNPSNPCGKVFTKEELGAIAELAIKYDTYVIMDEVYEHIIFDGRPMVYMNSLPGMWERTIACSSLSKTYSITGWRLGYAIACPQIMSKIKQHHDFNAVGAPAPMMEAAVVGLKFPQSYYDELTAHYSQLRRDFTAGLDAIGIPYTMPQGTYFIMADMAPYMKKGQTDKEFAVELIEKLGVAVVAGSSFFIDGTDHYVRMHFAKTDESLTEALNRLEKIKTLR